MRNYAKELQYLDLVWLTPLLSGYMSDCLLSMGILKGHLFEAASWRYGVAALVTWLWRDVIGGVEDRDVGD
jgi:hypothetical protein